MTNVKCISCCEVKTGTVVVASGLEEAFLLNTIHIKKTSRKHQKRGNKVSMVLIWKGGSGVVLGTVKVREHWFQQTLNDQLIMNRWNAHRAAVRWLDRKKNAITVVRVRGNVVRRPLLLLTSVPQKNRLKHHWSMQLHWHDSIGF